jgi:hypothetical protein
MVLEHLGGLPDFSGCTQDFISNCVRWKVAAGMSVPRWEGALPEARSVRDDGFAVLALGF